MINKDIEIVLEDINIESMSNNTVNINKEDILNLFDEKYSVN